MPTKGGNGQGRGPQHALNKEQQGVCRHFVALPFTLKSYRKPKEELWELKYFTMQRYNLQKNPLKEAKILQDIRTLL